MNRKKLFTLAVTAGVTVATALAQGTPIYPPLPPPTGGVVFVGGPKTPGNFTGPVNRLGYVQLSDGTRVGLVLDRHNHILAVSTPAGTMICPSPFAPLYLKAAYVNLVESVFRRYQQGLHP